MFVSQTNENRLFVSHRGYPLGRENISQLVRGYIVKAGITKKGSCHLLRHTAATLMMHNGADLRSIQELLGHAKLTTTQIYTHVTINDLKRVHSDTHPAERDELKCPK